jgi:hypothetical protein
MDYIDGETLTQFVEHHPKYFYNRKNSDRFISQLLGAVGYLHNHQIVHLDLKPNNILITHIGHDVKLVDLGCCYTDCYPDTTGSTSEYAAPEQREGSGKVDERTDIYAIGRILQTLPCAPYNKDVIKKCTAMQMDLRYSSIEELRKALHPRHCTWSFFAISAIAITVFSVAYIYCKVRSKPTV